MVDTHLFATAHADDHVGGDGEIHCREPDVHDADFGHGGALGCCDDWGESDSLLKYVIAAFAHRDRVELIASWANDHANASE